MIIGHANKNFDLLIWLFFFFFLGVGGWVTFWMILWVCVGVRVIYEYFTACWLLN